MAENEISTIRQALKINDRDYDVVFTINCDEKNNLSGKIKTILREFYQ